MAQVRQRDVDSFRSEFPGPVLTAGDADYDKARSVWNGAIDRRPALIAKCSTAADVAMAIKFARSSGLEVSVRGGGHSFAGFAVADGALMIDLSPMRQVDVDPARRRALCGGGATWGDVDAATQAHGLAVPGGFISHTGIGGLTLGGGFGWLTQQFGLSADNLVSAEVVTADGKILRAAADENADLFWAIRGGGGNFGVVTRFEYQLHPVGPLVQLGLFFWAADQGVAALELCRSFVREAPPEYCTFIAGLSAPPEPFVPEQYRLAPGYALLVVGLGSADEHARAVAPIRESLPPAFELITPIPYTHLQRMFDEGNQWGTHAYEKALHLDELSDEAIKVFTDYLPRKSSPLSFVPVFTLGGAYRQVGDDDTAFSGSRQARYIVNIAAVCPDPALLETDRAWVRAFWEALRPHASGSGSYVNFMSENETNRVRASYGPAKYDRLAQIKAKYDPDNVFHLNPNVQPART